MDAGNVGLASVPLLTRVRPCARVCALIVPLCVVHTGMAGSKIDCKLVPDTDNHMAHYGFHDSDLLSLSRLHPFGHFWTVLLLLQPALRVRLRPIV